jgi:hypothetical protein
MQPVAIYENEAGVWIEEHGDRTRLTSGDPVCLPRFEGHPYAPWLRSLHTEMLVNLMPVGPVPNLWVYPRPWYRDAAMVLMCLRLTNNLHLVESWVRGLSKVFDRNNAGEREADNLGQVLFMVSLFEANHHPIIQQVLNEIPGFSVGEFILGRTDGAEHPVYQTKWLKFGLRSLGLDDHLKIPSVHDSYSSLFWMDYRDEHLPLERFLPQTLALYPYLNWAEAHFYNEPPPEPLDNLEPPLTHESEASEAEYWRMEALEKLGVMPGRLPARRTCFPHTWHAAEMFLYLFELR